MNPGWSDWNSTKGGPSRTLVDEGELPWPLDVDRPGTDDANRVMRLEGAGLLKGYQLSSAGSSMGLRSVTGAVASG